MKELEGIMLSEISRQRKTNSAWHHLYMKSKNKLVNITEQTHTSREQTSSYQWGEGSREGQDTVGG